MTANDYSALTDKELVAGVVTNDPGAIEYLFYERCSRLFIFVINSIFGGKAERDELLNELFLYLAANNWQKLRDFDFRSTLYTWISVVAIRFFQRKRTLLIENESSEALILQEELKMEPDSLSMDLNAAINLMPNERYKTAIVLLDIEDRPYEEVASLMDVSIPNLYNIHRRALAQLKLMLLEYGINH